MVAVRLKSGGRAQQAVGGAVSERRRERVHELCWCMYSAEAQYIVVVWPGFGYQVGERRTDLGQ